MPSKTYNMLKKQEKVWAVNEPYRRIERFVARMKKNYHFIVDGCWRDIVIDWNRKYAKICSILSNGQKCAVNFIDIKTGDVYRAKSWKQKGRKVGYVDTFFN